MESLFRDSPANLTLARTASRKTGREAQLSVRKRPAHRPGPHLVAGATHPRLCGAGEGVAHGQVSPPSRCAETPLLALGICTRGSACYACSAPASLLNEASPPCVSQAVMVVADSKNSLQITGTGDVLEPHDGIIGARVPTRVHSPRCKHTASREVYRTSALFACS